MERREFIEPIELRPTVERLAREWADETPRFVRNFENAVYELPTSPKPLYLRLTPETHHSREEVAAELDFVRYLGSRGLPVSRPVRAHDGSYVREARVERLGFTACVFEEAPGRPYEEADDVNHGAFFYDAGRLMAEVHEAGAAFRPVGGFRRFAWDEDRWPRFSELVPEREAEAWALHDELMGWLKTLPKGPSSFGPIHGDFTIANLRIDRDRVALFDLDSCCEHWHAYEVAVFLHYFGARPALRGLAYERVLEGYASVRSVGDAFVRSIPPFAKMRLLYSFLVFATEWGFEDLNPEQEDYFEVRRRLFAGAPLWPPS